MWLLFYVFYSFFGRADGKQLLSDFDQLVLIIIQVYLLFYLYFKIHS